MSKEGSPASRTPSNWGSTVPQPVTSIPSDVAFSATHEARERGDVEMHLHPAPGTALQRGPYL